MQATSHALKVPAYVLSWSKLTRLSPEKDRKYVDEKGSSGTCVDGRVKRINVARIVWILHVKFARVVLLVAIDCRTRSCGSWIGASGVDAIVNRRFWSSTGMFWMLGRLKRFLRL